MNLDGIHFGQLDVRVVIEEPTVAVQSVSSERLITGWTTVRKVWAKRASESAEKIEANQGVAITKNGYVIRYMEDVNETMRINDIALSEYHYILGIERVDRKRFMVLHTERRDNGEG